MDTNLRALVEEVKNSVFGSTFVPPVQSLMENDFYKFTMGQWIHKYYPDVVVTFKVIIRDKKVRLFEFVDREDLERAFDHLRSLRFRRTDLYYLRGIDLYEKYMFKEEFLQFLWNFQLPPYQITQSDGVTEISFTGKWCEVSQWETLALPLIMELYYRGVMKRLSSFAIDSLFEVLDHRLVSNLYRIRNFSSPITFADFSLRRRFLHLWQKHAVKTAVKVLGNKFVGTSNTWMAFNQDLVPIGTNAHEMPMVAVALQNHPDDMISTQYDILRKWEEMYGQAMRIMLPDTYGSEQFYRNAPEFLKNWRGQRQDSGDPIVEGERYKAWLRSHGIDPKTKISIFSDGLNVPEMERLASHFNGNHLYTFGWGTLFANDTEGVVPGNEDMRPFSIVCKVVGANGRPCVKLSNNPNKATGPKEEIDRYMKIFHPEGLVASDVVV